MRNMKLFWLVIRRCHFERFLLIFVISFFLVAIIVRFHEPGINDFGDAMWYTFVSCTTIGFGDFTVTTTLSRFLTVFLTIYEIVLVALLSGVIVSHYLEVIRRRESEAAVIFLDKLEHLTELSYDELLEIQIKAKRLK